MAIPRATARVILVAGAGNAAIRFTTIDKRDGVNGIHRSALAEQEGWQKARHAGGCGEAGEQAGDNDARRTREHEADHVA